MLISRFSSLAAVILLSFSSLGSSSVAEPGLLRRDDPPPPSSARPQPSSAPPPESSTVATPSDTPKPTGSATRTSSAPPEETPSAASSSVHGNHTTSNGIVIGPSATPITGNASLGNLTNIPVIDGLPVDPQVTPALAVAGALLIVSGALYTLIGIKTKWLHIFFSTTYLFSLCVIVLIVYVMHPPISNAIQGAYLVAAAVTGLIFGAVAVIFSDVTEGLGCFLGGFCLGMWFLSLKPNGLIESQAGKSIFLGCFTVGIFGLYVSHYTRPYGLIGSTSFAGATAVCLGVDMFSRAGLKEFWLYIWDLNDGLFPLNYNGPYPITRGMRVEIACTVLLCLLGVMSQMKVWNIVKQRREQKEAEQRRRDQLRDEAEEELGRRVESDNDRDRAVWDAVYGKGKGSQTETRTSQTSTRKGSMSVVSTQEAGGMEMQSLASASSSVRKGIVTVHVGEDDSTALPSPADAYSIRSKALDSKEPSILESRIRSPSPGAVETTSIAEPKPAHKKPNVDPKLTLKPKYVPLPFQIPGSTTQQDDDDKSSVATFAESMHGQARPGSGVKRLSGSNLMRKLSGRSKKSPILPTTSQEALIVDEDRASSVAVTLDGISTHNHSQEKLGSFNGSPKDGSTGFATPEPLPSPGQEDVPSSQFAPVGLNGVAGPSHTEAKPDKDEALQADKKRLSQLDRERFDAKPAMTASSEAEPRLIPATLSGNLPDSTSKVVMAYRTNEWAKHLDKAEAPVFEEVSISKRSATPTQEAAAPLNVAALQQTALTAEPAPISIPSHSTAIEKEKAASPKSPTSSRNPFSRSSPRVSPSTSNTNLAGAVPRSPSQTSLSSTHSNEAPRPALPRARTSSSSLNRGLRSSSTPLVSSPLAEPIDENAETSFPPRFTPSPMHLLSQRESTVQSRPSSTSLLNRSGSAGPQRSFSASPSLVNIYETIDASNDDDVPLAQRRSILQQQSQQASQTSLLPAQRSNTAMSGASSNLNLSRNPSRLSLAQGGRPHQSATYNPTASTNTITSWRTSLANDAAHQNAAQTAEIEQKRMEMMMEKQATRNSRAIERMQEQARKSVIDKEMMRRGSGLMDAHREAMRRMQRGANESLKNGNGSSS